MATSAVSSSRPHHTSMSSNCAFSSTMLWNISDILNISLDFILPGIRIWTAQGLVSSIVSWEWYPAAHWGGLQKQDCVARNVRRRGQWKNYSDRLKFAAVMTKIKLAQFFSEHNISTNEYHIVSINEFQPKHIQYTHVHAAECNTEFLQYTMQVWTQKWS